jgi:hypothetical protein
MPDTSRRAVLTGAAGLAAGSALSLPAPVLAEPIASPEVDKPFRMEPSAKFLEIRQLQKGLAEIRHHKG